MRKMLTREDVSEREKKKPKEEGNFFQKWFFLLSFEGFFANYFVFVCFVLHTLLNRI